MMLGSFYIHEFDILMQQLQSFECCLHPLVIQPSSVETRADIFSFDYWKPKLVCIYNTVCCRKKHLYNIDFRSQTDASHNIHDTLYVFLH